MAKSVIITCAVTGAIHTPTMSEYLPITPNEVAESAIAAADPYSGSFSWRFGALCAHGWMAGHQWSRNSQNLIS